MRKFQCLLSVLKRSYIYYIICMTVPLFMVAILTSQFPIHITIFTKEKQLRCSSLQNLAIKVKGTWLIILKLEWTMLSMFRLNLIIYQPILTRHKRIGHNKCFNLSSKNTEISINIASGTSLFRCEMRLLVIINYFCIKELFFRNKRKIEKQCFSRDFKKKNWEMRMFFFQQ